MTEPLRLVALETSPPAFPTEAAARMAREIFGIDGTAHPLYGERDQNFRIKTASGPGIILKILGPTEDPQTVAFQTEALGHIAMMDPALPVPRVRRTVAGEAYTRIPDERGIPHIVRALDFQPGRVMDSVDPSPALLRHAGGTLARLNLALSNFFHPAAGQRIVWDLRRAVDLRPSTKLIEDAETRKLVETVLDRFIAFLPQMSRLRHQMAHNDLHPGNMLVDEGATEVTGLLDFGDMIHAPLVFDVAVTAAETVGEMAPIDYGTAIVAGYDAVMPLQDAEFPALFEAIIARHALITTIQAWRRHHDPAGAEKLGALSALGAPAIEAYLSAGREAVVAKFRAAAAAKPGAGNLLERRFHALGRGLELSYDEPVHLVRGEGVFLYAPDGTRFLDAYNNVPSVGHGNRKVAATIARQMETLCANTRYLHESVVEYAERVTATLPAGLDTCLYVNSGSEANDAAYRIAKIVTGQTGAIVVENAYHGVTDIAAALSPYHGPFVQPLAPFVQTLPSPDSGADPAVAARQAIAALRESGHGVAMLLIDSAFVSNGIVDVPPGWFAAVAEEVRKAGGLVVGDEVQSGFGRMGDEFWGFALHGVVPDLVTLGKPMANGHPTGMVVAPRALLKAFTDKIDFFSTFGGNPVSAAASLATLEELQSRGLQENAHATGEMLRQGIRALNHPAIAEVRGRGLMIGVQMDGSAALTKGVANAMRRNRVLIGTEGPQGNVLKIRPPLPFGPAHVEIFLDALRASLP